MTGLSNCPATSRRMWMASDSSAFRCGLATRASGARSIAVFSMVVIPGLFR